MITSRIFLAGPLDGTEQQVDSKSLGDIYVTPQAVFIGDRVKIFSTAYRLDRDPETNSPIRDNHGRVIYRYSGAIPLSDKKRLSWVDSFDPEKVAEAICDE